MIRAIQTIHDAQEFAARVHGQLYFRSAMGMRLELFWQKPGSGWRFCLTDGGALMLRGDSAQLCGGCRDKDEAEELTAFLRFCGVRTLLCRAGEEDFPWKTPLRRAAFCLPKGENLPGFGPAAEGAPLQNQAPAGLTLETAPRMAQVAALLFDDREEQERFYSDSCTAIAHGMGSTWALRAGDDSLAATVSCCACYDGESYLAAGMTAPPWRGQGTGAWLITAMAACQAQSTDVVLLCEPALCSFYEKMGLHQGPDFALYTLPE